MYFDLKSNSLYVPSVLENLNELAFKEKTLASLTTLNKLISSCQEEVEILYQLNGISIIVTLFKNDDNITNICLKILTNASKRHEKVREELINNNIFNLLTIKLNNETDFSKGDLILYSALIVVLVQKNYEAQKQMRISGCLSRMILILHCILDKAEFEPLPGRNIELIIYAIIASTRNSWELDNQEFGWIIPKILEFIEKRIIFPDGCQVEKFCWLLLKTALDNKENQRIFVESSGLPVLFRSIQEIVENENSVEPSLLQKLTEVLLKMASNKNFLAQASEYCPLMILCSLLKACNRFVIQNVIIFLNILIQENPQILYLINNQEIIREIQKAEIFFLKHRRPTAAVCTDILNQLDSLHFTEDFRYLNQQQNFFCIVHDSGTTHDYYDFTFDSNEETESQNSDKIQFSGAYLKFYKKEFQKERSLRKSIEFQFSHEKKSKHGVFRNLIYVFQKLWSYLNNLSVYSNKEILN